MKNIKQYFLIGSCLLLVQLLPCNVNAQDKKMQIGLQAGPFIPQNWQVQGYDQINYSDGSPVSAITGSFGNGFNINLSISYYFTGWGINLKSGACILEKKLDMAFAPSGERENYENKLEIFPITLSVINKIDIPKAKLTPYFGMGSGVLIARWEQKDFPETGQREWYKGNATPIDFHFLAGFTFSIYYDLLFNGEISYNYASTTWEIENVDTNEMTQFRNFNIGGVAMKVGIAFRF